MGTRSGDIDPAIFGILAHEDGLSPGEVEHLLNTQSGLLGLSGRSRDMRDLLGRERDAPRARRTGGEIGAPGARLRIFVIPADEELVIARETVACLRKRTSFPPRDGTNGTENKERPR